jgi:uncharacterized protein (TIGR00725 family)
MMVAVCGPSEATLDELQLAEAVGEALARAGCTVICGGRDGVMAAVCRGSKRAGGITIGVLPSYDRTDANPWVDHVICTGMGEARNVIIVASADVVIAIGGGLGTLSEIALALKLRKRVVALGSWQLDDERLARHGTTSRYCRAGSVEQAVALALTGSPGQRSR